MKEIRKSVMCFVVALCTILVTLLPQVVYADKEFSDSTYAGHIYCISNDSGHGQLVAGDEFTLEELVRLMAITLQHQIKLRLHIVGVCQKNARTL